MKIKKILSVVMAFAIACSLCAGFNMTASASTPKITFSEQTSVVGVAEGKDNGISITYLINFGEELDLTKLEIETTFLNATGNMNSSVSLCNIQGPKNGYLDIIGETVVSNSIVDGNAASTYKFSKDYDVNGEKLEVQTSTNYSSWATIASDVLPVTIIKYDGKEIYPNESEITGNGSKDVTISAASKIPAPTYTVTIPASIDIGSVSGALEKYRNSDTDRAGDKIIAETPFTVSASGVSNLFDGKTLSVSIGTTGSISTISGDGNTINCKLNKAGTSYTEGTEFACFINDLDLEDGGKNEQKGAVLVNRCDITKTADYKGILTFNIEIKEGN